MSRELILPTAVADVRVPVCVGREGEVEAIMRVPSSALGLEVEPGRRVEVRLDVDDLRDKHEGDLGLDKPQRDLRYLGPPDPDGNVEALRDYQAEYERVVAQLVKHRFERERERVWALHVGAFRVSGRYAGGLQLWTAGCMCGRRMCAGSSRRPKPFEPPHAGTGSPCRRRARRRVRGEPLPRGGVHRVLPPGARHPARPLQVGFRPWHDLRHTSLTHEAAAGNPQAYVQLKAGHSQGTITERYIHAAQVLFPGAASRGEERMFGGDSFAPSGSAIRDFPQSYQHRCG